MAFNTGVGPDTRKASSPPPPFGKKPGAGVVVAVGVPKGGPMKGGMDDEESPAHEASESPDQENGENYGEKLVSDIDNVFSEYGAPKAVGREIAGKIFAAVAKCLSQSGGGEEGGY